MANRAYVHVDMMFQILFFHDVDFIRKRVQRKQQINLDGHA